MNLIKVNLNGPKDETVKKILRNLQLRRYSGPVFERTKKWVTVRNEHGRQVAHRGGQPCRQLVESHRINWASIPDFSPKVETVEVGPSLV